MSIEIKRSDKYVDYNISAANNRGYITIDTSDWINKPWMFYELPALKFEIYTETEGELVKYQNFTREIRTYNPVYSPLGVLNVTIDIRNVPEEFILRITPIFDNDAIAARNMLIENGIENGDIWGSDQGVPTQTFNLDLEFIECEGEYIPPTPPVPPTHEETITGIPPITFDGSTGEPLVSWTILGNSYQSGSLTPDNPVMPEFVGVRTANLFDTEDSTSGYNIASNGEIVENSNYSLSGYIPVAAGTYTLSGKNTYNTTANIANRAILYDENKENPVLVLGATGAKPVDFEYTIQIPASGFLVFSFRVTDINIMLNSGSNALPYEPFGYKIPITCAEQTTPVYLGEVKTVRKIRKLVLDGTETWSIDGGKNGLYSATNASLGIFAPLQSYAYQLSSHFALADSYNTIYYNTEYFAIQTSRLIISYFAKQSVDSFKAYLTQQYAAGTPVTIWYVLAEPETEIVNEPLAKIGDYADELSSTDAGVTITTAEGQNTLTVDTDLQPSEITITYIKEGQ